MGVERVDMFGLRIDRASKHAFTDQAGVITILANEEATLRIFGTGLKGGMKFKFAFSSPEAFHDEVCDESDTTRHFIAKSPIAEGDLKSVLLTISLPDMPTNDGRYYLCVRDETTQQAQGQPDTTTVFIFYSSSHFNFLPTILHNFVLTYWSNL
jgi:hypothetical protein